MAPPAALTWEEISSILTFQEEADIQRLYRAIFGVRQMAPSQAEGIDLLIGAISARKSKSVLFRHECCYLLGQLGADTHDLTLKQRAFDGLLHVLTDLEEDEVTRHEAAEGIAAVFNYNLDASLSEEELGSIKVFFDKKHEEIVAAGIGADSSSTDPLQGELSEDSDDPERQSTFLSRNRSLIEILSRFSTMETALGQTCWLAVEGLKRETAKVCACQYVSYDPAIGDQTATRDEIPQYFDVLKDRSAPFFQRYVAMFTLRNLCAEAELASVLDEDTSSAVLRHEISFVLGQMESETARDALIRSLEKDGEHPMVRHESAIALGSIGTEVSKVKLQQFVNDSDQMVADSCLVALDTIAYWEAWEEEEERIRNS